MPVSANEAADRYERGIRAIGIQAYREASGASSPSEAAETLEQAKSQSLDVNTLVSKYQDAY